jgi:cytochrome c oxidase cbb3-type subunit IV
MRQFLENVQGVDVYLITSLFIFLFFFVAVGIWFFTVDKKYLKTMSDLPIGDEEPQAK